MDERHLRRWIALVALGSMALAMGLVACGDDELPTPSAEAVRDGSAESDGVTADSGDEVVLPPTEESACRAYTEAFCQRYEECSGTRLDCEQYLSLCPAYFFAPGSTRSPDELLSCALLRRAQSCEELNVGLGPPCTKPGTRGAGEPCWFASQCSSLTCAGGGAGGACGACAALIPDDTSCGAPGTACGPSSRCEGVCRPIVVPPVLPAGSACPAPDGGLGCGVESPCLAATSGATAGTCTTPPGEGSPCLFHVGTDHGRCRGDAVCVIFNPNAPVKSGTCVRVSQLNEPCGPASPPCALDLACNNEGRCVVGKDLDELCSGASPCRSELLCTGVCRPKPALGEPCFGSLCAPPYTCRELSTDAGVARTCVELVGLGAPCEAFRHCRSPLECQQGVCALTACPKPAPDAGGDGG